MKFKIAKEVRNNNIQEKYIKYCDKMAESYNNLTPQPIDLSNKLHKNVSLCKYFLTKITKNRTSLSE
ncbi:hypothetical protein D9O36_17105 [Zobellia amurskyensis]|uniref:Uncharacterized protein n=1 Tax=Zobellia amurskyensis TaxID=248905 RepID=A0A7X2ZWD2_9FLAO|nr:hypothetical protein [Zobellia amurskyensis]